MATPTDTEPETENSSSNPNPANLGPNALAISSNQSSTPLLCFVKFGGDSIGGAFMGSIFGLGIL